MIQQLKSLISLHQLFMLKHFAAPRCGVYPTWILYSTLIDAENFVEMFPAYYIFNGLLGTLQLLHILWTYFLFKAIQKALSKGGVDDKRSDSEPSDEEDENDNELKKDI